MTCKSCDRDRGYQRPNKRRLACMSCGQTGKMSGRKDTKLTKEQKENISAANLKWRRSKDPSYRPLDDTDKRVIHNMRCRLWQVIKSPTNSLSKSLGCRTYELREYLESKFEEGMTWDNYGSDWEIDHIKPLSKFDLKNDEEFREVCNYNNLQPLWKKDNRSKGARHED